MNEQNPISEEESIESPRELVARILSVETTQLIELRRRASEKRDVEEVRALRGEYQTGVEGLSVAFNDRIVCGMIGSALILIKAGDPESTLSSDIGNIADYLDQIGQSDEADVLWKYLKSEEIKSEQF